jgi:hypothetical protein
MGRSSTVVQFYWALPGREGPDGLAERAPGPEKVNEVRRIWLQEVLYELEHARRVTEH